MLPTALAPGRLAPLRRPLVVVAPGVADAEALLDGLVAGAQGARLEPGGGIAALAALVADIRPSALHVVAHGRPGLLRLGDQTLSLATLDRHRPALAAIGAVLGAGATLHLWACGVGAGPRGHRFIRALARATGLGVAAASAAVGRHDGTVRWDLDRVVDGRREACPFTPIAQAAYPHALTLLGTATTYAVGGGPNDIAFGPAGGTMALAVANISNTYFSVLLSNGNGTFQTQTTYGAAAGQYGINFAKLSSSAYTDLIVAEVGQLQDFQGNGGGTFATPTTINTSGAQPVYGIAATTTSSSYFEAAVPATNSTSLVIVTGSIGSTLTSVQSISLGFTPGAAVFGDFNGDGNPDIAVTDKTNGNIDILLGGSVGSFSTPVAYAVGSNPIAVTVGEVDGDGNPDLVVANNASSTVTVWHGTSNGTFTAPVTYTVSSPTAVRIADLNGDGYSDIVVTTLNSSYLSVLLNAGSGSTSGTFYPTAQTYAVPSSTAHYGLAVADFNGDGKPDVASVDQTNNNAIVLLNTAASASTSITLTAAPVFIGSSNDTIVGTSPSLITANGVIDGGAGTNMLQLNGTGTFDLTLLSALKHFQSVSIGTGTLGVIDSQLVAGGGSVNQITGTGIETVKISNVGSTTNLSGVTFSSIPTLKFSATTALLSTTAATSALPTTVIAGGSGSGILVVGSNMIRSGVAYTLGTSGSQGELDVSGGASSTLDFSQLLALNNTKIIRNLQTTGSSTSVTLPSFVNVTYVGGANSETVSAANAAVTVFGGSGNEKIVGGSGSGQILIGGAGTDTLLGGSSATTIFGSDSNFFTSAGVKSITGAAGGTVLIGRQNTSATGVDTITATVGAETLFGGTASAKLVNGEPTSAAGACVLVGGSGGANTIMGGNCAGNADTLFGGATTGTNYITAGVGASQTLVGGAGALNYLKASQNADDVLFAASSGTNIFVVQSRGNGGTVKIVNFVHGRDTIDLSNVDSYGGYVNGVFTTFSSAMVAASVTSFSNGYNIQLPGGSSGTQNIQVITGAGFSASDFMF